MIKIEVPFSVLPCDLSDFPHVMPLLGQLWPGKLLHEDSLRQVFEQALSSSKQVYVAAKAGERLVGFGSLSFKNSLWQEGDMAYIDELVIDVEYRGRGIGSMILEHLAQEAKNRGCRRIELDSAFHRAAAHQFYEQLGFERRAYIFSKAL